MPKYSYDLPGLPTAWINTDDHPDIKLPTDGVVKEMTEEEWSNRLDGNHASGFIKTPIPDTPEKAQVKRVLAANALLFESNHILMEYFEESLAAPADLVTYRKTLRTIIAGDTTAPVPAPYVKS